MKFFKNSKLKKCNNATPYFSLQGQMKQCKVVDIYDGDTCKVVFDLNGNLYKWNIRMEGYDSPEMRVSKKNPNRDEIKKQAMVSRNYFRFLVQRLPDQLVYIKCGGFDKYGRLLGTLYINKNDTKSVNDMMIEKNYGYEYDGGTKKDTF